MDTVDHQHDGNHHQTLAGASSADDLPSNHPSTTVLHTIGSLPLQHFIYLLQVNFICNNVLAVDSDREGCVMTRINWYEMVDTGTLSYVFIPSHFCRDSHRESTHYVQSIVFIIHHDIGPNITLSRVENSTT